MTPDQQARRLEAHLDAIGRPGRVTEWKALAGGRSATTVRFRVEDADGATDAVLHLQADDGPLAGMTDAGTQFALLEALEAQDVRAPKALWRLPDGVLGRAGYATDFVAGDVPDPFRRSGRELLGSHPANGPLAEDFLARMVAVHGVPVDVVRDALGVTVEHGRRHAEREHGRWSAVLAASPSFAADPLLAYADAWLTACRPESPGVGLVHGDYRMGNLVLDGERVACVLDWELADLGDPLYDLAAACSPALRTNGLACGLWEPEALVRRYGELTGGDVDVDALAYYGVLATFKIVCLWINAGRPFAAGSDDLVALRAGFSALECRPLLAEALGLPSAPATPVVDEPATRALTVVHRALRASAPDGGPIRLGAAVLQAMAAAPRRERVGFAAEVDELAADAGVETGPEGSASGRLAVVARALLADRALARDPDEPRHARLRGLVADAVSGSPAAWPALDVERDPVGNTSVDDLVSPG